MLKTKNHYISKHNNLIVLTRTKLNKRQIDFYVQKMGFYHYQIQHAPNDINHPIVIKERVNHNHYCDIVLRKPIRFNNTNCVILSTDDIQLLQHNDNLFKRYA